ncbi:hypothetical protein HK104_006354, partial [Borealophlyctis nickersoniae]
MAAADSFQGNGSSGTPLPTSLTDPRMRAVPPVSLPVNTDDRGASSISSASAVPPASLTVNTRDLPQDSGASSISSASAVPPASLAVNTRDLPRDGGASSISSANSEVAERLGRLEKLKDETGAVKDNSEETLRELLKISGKEKDYDVKIAILTMLAKTHDEGFLRRFAAKQGLKLIRFWMRLAVETPEHTITNPLGCVRLLWRSMKVLRKFPMDAKIYDLMVHEINLVPVLEELVLYKPGQNGKDDEKIQVRYDHSKDMAEELLEALREQHK